LGEQKGARERKLECWGLKTLYPCMCDAVASVIDGSPLMMIFRINISILIETYPRVAMQVMRITCPIRCEGVVPRHVSHRVD
jgi:hypothetical protein